MSSAGELAGLRVTVMGLGLFGGGSATVRWLVARGARVTVTDLREAEALRPALDELGGLDVEWVLGEHRARDFEHADAVVANPAVAPDNRWLVHARANGVAITSELALTLDRCPARIVLITGTQGKSSTASLLAQLLTAAGVRAHLGGNIGAPLLEHTAAMAAEDVAVIEVSSYQLEALAEETPSLLHGRAPGARPGVELAILTNVLADHLERHGTIAAYTAAKARICDHVPPGGCALLPDVPDVLEACRPRLDGRTEVLCHGPLRAAGPQLTLRAGSFQLAGRPLGAIADLRLPAFQRWNTLLALGAAARLGVPAEDLAPLVGCLTGLPHRCERLEVDADVTVIDNGVSTTPDSTVAALASIDGACTLLCGGRLKRDLPLDEMVEHLRASGSRVVAFGEGRSTLAAACTAGRVTVWTEALLADAVATALARTPPGGQLLFSPACSSFDAFPNFAARARAFRASLPGAASLAHSLDS